MTKEDRAIKIFSLESDEFFRIFLQDALVVYNPRDTEITFSKSIKEFLDKLSSNLPESPDIIFLTMAAPVEPDGKIDLQSGFKILKILKENEKFKKVPVVIFSKYKEKRLQKKALELGACRYLVKGECMPSDIAKVVACADKIHVPSFKAVMPWLK